MGVVLRGRIGVNHLMMLKIRIHFIRMLIIIIQLKTNNQELFQINSQVSPQLKERMTRKLYMIKY